MQIVKYQYNFSVDFKMNFLLGFLDISTVSVNTS
jgi:hypothetical protein